MSAGVTLREEDHHPITACPQCGTRSSENYEGRGLCYACYSSEARKAWENQAASNHTPVAPERPLAETIEVVTLEEFAVVDEEGAAPLVGNADSILIPQGGDVMFYGDGGAGKTTLSIDLAFHLGSGAHWLAIPVPQPVRVLLIESEGPRPLFRRKLDRKLGAWQGPALNGHVRVFSRPWAQFTFASEQWRAQLARTVADGEIDVLIAGPLTRLGMDSAGTLQEVVGFMELVSDVRRQCGRPLTVIVIHHENKAGAVSGAWEGAADTLLHVQAVGNGHTVVFVQKARWDSKRHGTTLKLQWADGEGFVLESDRNPMLEIVELLSDGRWRTAKEIAAPDDKDGIGANVDTVKAILEAHPDRFEQRTGEDAKALRRHPTATLWQLTRTLESPESPTPPVGGGGEQLTPDSTLKGVRIAATPPLAHVRADSDPQFTYLQCSCADGGLLDDDWAGDGRCQRCFGWPA